MRTQLRQYHETQGLIGFLPKGLALLEDAKDGDGDVVYVVQPENGGPVKIGHTSWDGRMKRLNSLQTANPHLLVFRRVVKGGMWLERALHQYFASARMRGEWFGLTEDMRHLCPAAFGHEGEQILTDKRKQWVDPYMRSREVSDGGEKGK